MTIVLAIGSDAYSHCVQDGRHVMWSMLTGNEVACACLYMYSAGDVSTFKGMLCECLRACVHMRVTSCRVAVVLGGLCTE